MPLSRHAIMGFIVAASIAMATTPARAHEGLHEQIARATRAIAAAPEDGELYLKRGELHRLHRDWDSALADFEIVARLDPAHPTLDYSRGRLFRQARWPRAALTIIDRFLATNADHGPGHLVRARALVDLGRPIDAADAFDRAIATLEKRSPDVYLERARVLAGAGVEHFSRAVSGLDEGIADLGPIVALELEAIEMELRLERHGEALARLERLASTARRKETWLARQARVLEAAGRRAEAAERFRRALAAMQALPARHRHVDAMKELEQEIRTGLDRLAAGPAPPE